MLVPGTGDDPVTSCFSATKEHQHKGSLSALECPKAYNTTHRTPQTYAQLHIQTTTDTTTARSFRAWLDSRFAGQRGYFCLGFIDGDPRLEPMLEEWYSYPKQAGQIVQRFAELAARGLNLYGPACLFSARKRSYANALPSRWLVADDVPAGAPCTDLVRTSEGSRQAWLQLDEPIGADDRKRLQTAWRDRLGADACSADAVHMWRVPGGYNRKHHACYLVQLEQHADRIYSAAQLLSKAPALERKAQTGEITDLAWPAVEHHLANIEALLASGRAQQIKPSTQTGRILGGELLSFPVNDRWDDSRSMNAAAVALGLLLRGFPDDEIAAVVFHLYRQWGVERHKGTAWCKADLGRLLAYAHEKAPEARQSPTRYKAAEPAAPLVEQPAASRARHDRPRQLDPLMLFGCYKADPALCSLSRKPRAAALGISTATLDRLDAALRAEGLIEIERPGRGLPGRVVVGGVINIGAEGVLSGAPIEEAAQPAIAAPECAEAEQASPQCIGETHQPPETPWPPAPRLRLADAVRQAFDQVRVDEETGEKRRVTRKRLLAVLAELGSWPAAAVVRAIENERERRRIAAILADIQGMSPATLRAQLRLMERLADKSRADGTNVHRYAEWAARELRAELASKPAEPGRKPRQNSEAMPSLRAAGDRYEQELLELVERTRPARPAHPWRPLVELTSEGQRVAGVSPQTTLPAEPAPNAGALLASLYRLRSERHAEQVLL